MDVGDLRSGGENDQTGDDLTKKLHLRRHILQVVIQSHCIDKRPPENDPEHFHVVGGHNKDRDHSPKVNGQSAETGDRVVMHPPPVLGDVYCSDLRSQLYTNRCHQPGNQKGDGQHHDHISHISIFPSFKIFSASGSGYGPLNTTRTMPAFTIIFAQMAQGWQVQYRVAPSIGVPYFAA